MRKITIQLDTPIEEKGMFDQIVFKEVFEITPDYKVLLKKTKTLFNGVLEVHYETGEKFGVYNYNEGKQEGAQISFFKNGNAHTKSSMVNGKYDKEYKIYYENGKTQTIGFYKKGIQLSLESYYENGAKNSSYINNHRGLKQEEKTYYASGVVKKHRIMEKNCIQIINYYENENKKSEGKESKKGKAKFKLLKTGLWKYYHENGNIKEEGNWDVGGVHGRSNIQIGIWKVYNEEGVLIENKKYN